VLHREHAFSDMFVAYLLTRNIRYEEDLVDQLFNSSEKRLARMLLLLAHFGKEGISWTRGLAFPAFIHNRTYFLTDITVYSDGLIDCWACIDMSVFRQKIKQG